MMKIAAHGIRTACDIAPNLGLWSWLVNLYPLTYLPGNRGLMRPY